jgi:hypothetical protein
LIGRDALSLHENPLRLPDEFAGSHGIDQIVGSELPGSSFGRRIHGQSCQRGEEVTLRSIGRSEGCWQLGSSLTR